MGSVQILKEPFTEKQIKQWDENLIRFLKDMKEWEEESKKVDFIIGQNLETIPFLFTETNPCEGCSNKGKICHCTLGQRIV